MSEDSCDLSDFANPRPSTAGSKSRLRSDRQKKRRIVMRIEFDDSDETTASSCSSGEEQPSCSKSRRNQRGYIPKQRSSPKRKGPSNSDHDSDEFIRNVSKRQTNQANVFLLNSSTDDSSSGTEVTTLGVKSRGKIFKKVIISEDEREINDNGQSVPQETKTLSKQDEVGFTSDSSSNELLEKCPICLLTFRQQEIGSPATCAHIFCANCIEAWSKNVQTCPIDRNEFDKIVVRESFENRNIVREISVDKGICSDKLQLEDDDVLLVEEEDVTNCEICNTPEREDVMLLCDSCNQGYHIDCLVPPLSRVPEGSWYCDNCFDSQDGSDDGDAIEEDLNLLYEDIRDMGIPQSRLRVTEVHQPRILRTRQNERIRAAILRHTRSTAAAHHNSTTTTRSMRSIYPRSGTTTTTTTTTTSTIRKKKVGTGGKSQRRRRRRRTGHRTYVVEYDLNNYDEKFAIKTTKKVIRRRRRKRRSVKKVSRRSSSSVTKTGVRRLTSSQRLAEQMGVKKERSYINPTRPAGSSALSLFGNANDLEYFSDGNEGDAGFESEIQIETGHGTALQTSVRISNFGSLRSRKSLLLDRLQHNLSTGVADEIVAPQPDILSNIMDMQDRWHSASRHMESIRLAADGTLQLPTREGAENSAIPTSNEQNGSPQVIIPCEVTQAPMYPNGSGGNQSFNSGGGRYSNSFNSQNSQRGGSGGGGNQYRHSTGSSSGGLSANFSMVGRGNFSFSNPDYNSNQNQTQTSNFPPFNNRDRFNPRNRQQQQRNNLNNNNNVNNNQRNSFPFSNFQPSQQQSRSLAMDNQLFGSLPTPVQPQSVQQPLRLPQHNDRQLFRNLPPSVASHLPRPNEQQLFSGLPPPRMAPPLQIEQQLFSGLPPPVVQQHHIPPPPLQSEQKLFGSLAPPMPPNFGPQLPSLSQQPVLLQPPLQSQLQPSAMQAPTLPNMNIPPPSVGPAIRAAVPPPPAPPAALTNWNSSLFSYQDDEDDDSNCPNFSIYSAESQEVAKASENKSFPNESETPKEDDENEDLVQLDDDDDIPIPPDNNSSRNSDLYEPENPTEENDNETENNLKDDRLINESEKDLTEKQAKLVDEAKQIDSNQYDPEQETDSINSINDEEEERNEKTPEEPDIQEICKEHDEVDKENVKEKQVEVGEEAEKDKEIEREKENENEEENEADRDTEAHAKVEVEKDKETHKNDKENDNGNEIEKFDKKNDTDVHSPSSGRPAGRNKLPDADVASSNNRKGVLELYDDSDWDELDIDRPRSTERMDSFILGQVNEETANLKHDRNDRSNIDKEEEDRSYTPCLDEKNDPEDEPEVVASVDGGGTPEISDSILQNTAVNVAKKKADEEDGIVNKVADNVAIETELISEEDENMGGHHATSRRRKDKRNKRGTENTETFKKVSSKQKERNYRTEKAEKRRGRTRGGSSAHSRSKSPSKSRSKSRSISRSRSPSRSRSRSRTRSRSRSGSRLRPRSHSRPRSPPRDIGTIRHRRRRPSRTPPLRSSRSRSNDKENFFSATGYQGHGRFNRGGFNNRFQNSRYNHRFYQRPRRRELPRYDVRNVVGQARNLHLKDRYGRDTSRPPHRNSRSLSRSRRRRSFSASRSRSFSASPKRLRRNSFSISPSPEQNQRSVRRTPPPRTFSPQPRPQPRIRRSPISQMYRRKSRSPGVSSHLRNIRSSRSVSPMPRKDSRKPKRHLQAPGSPRIVRRQSRSISASPRYTPRLSRSCSISQPSQSPHVRQKNKKKKIKDRKKKKAKKRVATSKSPEPARRTSRQRDPYELDLLTVAAPSKRKRHHSSSLLPNAISASPPIDEPTWSPSPSPPPICEYDNNVSWTPPLVSPRIDTEFTDMFTAEEQRHDVLKSTTGGKKEKRKREKKKKKGEKRREPGRKEKRRGRRTETPEPAQSKEVFASGNNILVSVSFNKEAAAVPAALQAPQQQTTVVTLPPTREDVVSGIRRGSTDRQVTSMGLKRKKDKGHKRKKLDTKPVAIIDLERSPFQVHQEPADIIVLTDSEGGNDDDENERHHSEQDHHLSESGADDMELHHRQRLGSSSGGGGHISSHQDQTPPLMSTIMEETSYELQQTGPKTPPEPPVIKFTLLNKQQVNGRNPLHDATDDLNQDDDEDDEDDMMEMEEEQIDQQQQQQQHHQDMDGGQTNQKIGPNTPPESGPCSPDVYDPFDPTKSPSLSPRSPTPPPLLLDKSQNSIDEDSCPDVMGDHNSEDLNRQASERNAQQQISTSSAGGGSQNTATTTLNPVELVMALMNSKQQATSSQDMTNKSMESQYSGTSSHILTSSSVSHDETHGSIGMQDKSDDGNSVGGSGGVTVLSNLLISSAKPQHIPTISSPTPMPPKNSHNMISKLPLPKIVTGSSGSGGSGIGLPNNLRNGADDSFNDIESPYSPGSADYEDLFEPPPDNTNNSKRRSKRGGKDKFDNLFGSSSPVGHLRLPSYAPSTKKYKSLPGAGSRKLKVAKVGKSGDEHIKVYDDVPNSAVELQVKDKFLRKLNRQERVVEEVKLILKPRFNKKHITKDDYKEIMRRAVPKICHSRSGEINPNKIKNLIEAYVKKFRAKHKKLNIINTGQVSSAVKCAAYLKKL